MTPLRVLRLCSVFEPPASALTAARFDPIGGMQEHTASLTRALARRGVDQVVLTARPPTAPWRERIAPGATVIRVALPVRRPRQLYSLPAAVLAPLLGRRADLVHAHLGEDLAVLPIAAAVARARRLPLVVTVHCSPSHTLAVCDVRTALLRTLGGWIERRTVRRAATTMVFTDRLAQLVGRDAGVSVQVVRRGVDRRAFAGVVPEAATRPRIVFVGRVVRAKGVETLVAAFAALADRDAELVLVGDGPDRPRVEALARRLGVAGRVRVTGFVSHDRVPPLLASAQLLVLPSFYEELGTVLVEAMQVALPVVATRVGGIPEVVEDGVTGLLVPPGDAHALAAAIDAVLANPQLARRLGAAGRRRAREYDIDRMADEVHDVYLRVVEEHRAAGQCSGLPPVAPMTSPLT